jgi:transposase
MTAALLLSLPIFASFTTYKRALTMPGKAAKILITERQQAILRSLRDSATVAVRLQQRATIILLAFDGLPNEDIAVQIGLERHQVGIWRRRWAKTFDCLIQVECCESAPTLRRTIEQVLTDADRPGAPGTFTPEQVTQIFAVACEPPEKSGRPITHWTNAELADEVVQRGIVPSISVSQVGRYLRQAQLKPHKSRYWLNTTEKDPQKFQAQVEAVCTCYLEAPLLYRLYNTHTVSVDEMTGVQALERKAPTLPMVPGLMTRIEFEYERNGTLCLIGNLEVTTGELIRPTLGPTRTEKDFVGHIMQTVGSDPTASWVFIVDNLNTHASESLVKYVAQKGGMTEELGKKGVRGILKSIATRQAWLSELGHRIRFVYVPKHTSWLNQIEGIFGIIMRKVVRRGSFKSVAELRDKLLRFIDYFNSC